MTLERLGITSPPDYSDYPSFTASIGFTQRGCRLSCSFCDVPTKEGKAKEAGSVEEGVAKMRRTFQGWDAPVTLEELGVSEADIPAIVAAAQKVGVLGRLKELTPEDLAAILRLAL